MTAAPTILVADDDPAFLEAMATRLGANGYTIVKAQDAIQAVRRARERMPDLLVLDVNMPAGDGFCVEERIREIDGLTRVPVVYVTGDRSTRASYGAAEAGARLLYKPVDTDVLLDSIAEALGRLAAPGPATAPAGAGAGTPQDRALAQLQQAALHYHGPASS